MNYSSFEAGDIVILDFQFSDFQGSKPRPALVITPKKYNDTSSDIIVLKVTSAQNAHTYAVALDQQDLQEGTLNKPSVVRTDYPLVAEKQLVRNKIAKVKPAFLGIIKKKIAQIYER